MNDKKYTIIRVIVGLLLLSSNLIKAEESELGGRITKVIAPKVLIKDAKARVHENYDTPTIAELSVLSVQQEAKEANTQEFEALLDMVEEMSSEEIESLLGSK